VSGNKRRSVNAVFTNFWGSGVRQWVNAKELSGNWQNALLVVALLGFGTYLYYYLNSSSDFQNLPWLESFISK